MPEILYDFPIQAPVATVFAAIATPEGMDAWWTVNASGAPQIGTGYTLGFGTGCVWGAVVSRSAPNSEFELELTVSDEDWNGSRVGFELEEQSGGTQVRFHHTGWKQANEHFRISGFCWAMYLRLLKRYCELGEVVPYNLRLSA